jgi:hypothetical protein
MDMPDVIQPSSLGTAIHLVSRTSNGKTSIVHYRTLSFFAIRLKKKTKVCFFRDFKYKITIKPVRFASILLSFNINQFASLP